VEGERVYGTNVFAMVLVAYILLDNDSDALILVGSFYLYPANMMSHMSWIT
jgi:hypothetical protein